MNAATDAERPPLVRRPDGKGQDLLCDEDLRPAVREGRAGVTFKVRLPSYRSLPLSCILDLTVSIDGRPVRGADLVLLLDNNAHRLDDVRDRIDLWWFVLDPAEVFAPVEDLATGEHLIEVGLREAIPYATGGKTALSHACAKHLRLTADE
jgi:hypothetical protein